jgi:uncharacterized protein YvpB
MSRGRASLARAQRVGVDTAADGAQLNRAQGMLDSAPTSSAIIAAADVIRTATTHLDAAYYYNLAHPPPPPGAIVLNVPFYAQVYSLSCEAASLQMALASQGVKVNQDQVLAAMGVDRTPPRTDASGLHWGDPYVSFVGDPNGFKEGALWGAQSGYGVYYPPIARAAQALGGRVLQSGERISPAAVYAALAARHPVVLWVAYAWSPHPTTTYVANDGRTVMYGAPWEHAVTAVGVSDASILINDPHGGQRWIARGTFEASYAMFDNMAVILA